MKWTHNRWTEQQEAMLAQLWQEGKTGLQIANELGFTRNAVLGKARRMDLPAREVPESFRRGG